jgi:CSLREA domain-containing protein
LLSVFVVTNVNNSGDGSLQQAIFDANSHPGTDQINFNIPVIPGATSYKIAPIIALPAITDPVQINGESQSDYAGHPIIELDGTNAGDANGLDFEVGGNLVEGLDIHSFSYDGIVLHEKNGATATGGNTIEDNYIGTDPTGTVAMANGFDGVHLLHSPNDTIFGNLISGNTADGIYIADQFSTGAQIENNLIGTDATGLKPLGNGLNGVDLSQEPDPATGDGFASSDIVGGNTSDERNVIGGNGQSGVYIEGGDSNHVEANYIGVGADGKTPVPNGTANEYPQFGMDGVFITDSATLNEIGGNTVGQRNVISGNIGDGVQINAGAMDNQVDGNYIGTDSSGLNALSNGLNGVDLSAPPSPEIGDGIELGNIVGGTSADERNVISGNGRSGVNIDAAENNVVEANYIGVGADGATPIPNGTANQGAPTSTAGVFIVNSNYNEIGGDTAGVRNVISGNTGDGVEISAISTGNQIAGNYIGTDATGLLAVANTLNGVDDESASGNTVGGTSANYRNVISGNGQSGVYMNDAQNIHVEANYIGLGEDGVTEIENGSINNNTAFGTDGVFIDNSSTNDEVGGSVAGTGNVISGNFSNGVHIDNRSTNNLVDGNYIGTDAGGENAAPNTLHGVYIHNSSVNTIGGTAPAARNVISGNQLDGIEIFNDEFGSMLNGLNSKAGQNTILGNFIGLDALGIVRLKNGSQGIDIDNSQDNVIGGLTAGARNIISGNYRDGIDVGSESNFTVIEGNYIGTDVTGLINIENLDGMLIESIGNVIGGTTAAARNVISGNGFYGVEFDEVEGSTGFENVLEGNYIGTDSTGQDALGNGQGGVTVDVNAPDGGEIIGGTTVGARNIISGNARDGILIDDLERTGTASVLVEGNYIGTDVTGEFALPNTLYGVEVSSGSANTIGASATSAGAVPGNLISGNGIAGIDIDGAAAGAKVLGNMIGLDALGATALPNQGEGVLINGTSGNYIGDGGTGDANVISGNGLDGVIVQGSGATANLISGDYIGTDISGLLARPNLVDGVDIYGASGNIIGGVAASGRDIISGNGSNGVHIEQGASGNIIEGDYIGTDLSGAAPLGNGKKGVFIENSPGNAVGGVALIIAQPGNVISGNGDAGVLISGLPASENKVIGNDIGTDENGNLVKNLGNTLGGVGILNSNSNTVQANTVRGNNAGVGIEGASEDNHVLGNIITDNSGDGVLMGSLAFDNFIGDGNPGDFNVISRNTGDGVFVDGSSQGNEIDDNYIGTDNDGEFAAGDGNSLNGVELLGYGNTVQGNTIRGNLTNGIEIDQTSATGNLILGNTITNSTAQGVDIAGSASNNQIGGTNSGDGNLITQNTLAGVLVESGVGNAIWENFIYGNGGLGIDLAPVGVTPNDPQSALDADSGPNELQNYPVLTVATTGGSQQAVGYLDSAASETYRLEFFLVADPDPSGYGQGDQFLTATTVTTNASGVAPFDVTLPAGGEVGKYISATATDAGGNTSEFSKAVAIQQDTDGDGIPDAVEAAGPNNGDGNDDGIPDSQEANVVTLPDAVDGQYVTFSAPVGTTFSNVSALTNPSPADAPSDAAFSFGLFSFTLSGVTPGGSVDVLETLPAGTSPQSYYRYGPVPWNSDPQWYQWNYNGAGTPGAEINGNVITLHFIDGQYGDDDLTANGSVTDPGGPTFPITFTVTNTNDSGPGSLREAISDSDNDVTGGVHLINFDIPGGGLHTITTQSFLPFVSQPVDIDGASQPGYAGKPLIEIDGEVQTFPYAGLAVSAADTTIRGLAIDNYASTGLELTPSGYETPYDFDVVGNDIESNGEGIEILGGSGSIGDASATDGNVISGNSDDGIYINRDYFVNVQGNDIGVTADGTTPMGNGNDGIYLGFVSGDPYRAQSVYVGGLDPGDGNVIAYNQYDGIEDFSNELDYNGGRSQTYAGQNVFLSNSIYGNARLGISENYPKGYLRGYNDTDDGQDINEENPSADGISDPLNYPVLNSAISEDGQITITGHIDTQPYQTLVLQFFSSSQGTTIDYGQGQTLIGTAYETTDGNGHVDFTETFKTAVPDGRFISATSSIQGWGTSDFSQRIISGDVLSNVFVVNTTDDTDDGAYNPAHVSLRDAILAANAHPGTDTIDFDIPGSGVHTITPLTALPPITDSVIIDATTQPGYSGTPLIQIDGTQVEQSDASGAPVILNGLYILASGSTIKGLDIDNFARYLSSSVGTPALGAGIYMSGDDNVLQNCFIGCDPTGTIAMPNAVGLYVFGTGDQIGGTTAAERNVISGNFLDGLLMGSFDVNTDSYEGSGAPNIIQGNFVGTDITGTLPLGNGNPDNFNYIGEGVQIFGPAVVGGTTPGAANVISDNGKTGIDMSSGVLLEGNFIGTDVTGTRKLGNYGTGVTAGGNANTIGGPASGARNIISNNAVGIEDSGDGDIIQGNIIGSDITGTQNLGNSQEGLFLVVGNTLVGGSQPGDGNEISGNGGDGILIYQWSGQPGYSYPLTDVIEGNLIGTQADGVSPLGNTGNGIEVQGGGGSLLSPSGPNTIGGLDPGDGNTVAYNGRTGILLGNTGVSMAILSNVIYSDGKLGIDLNGDGVTPNDPLDKDSGADDLQNYPVLSTVVTDGVRSSITGTLNSTPNTYFYLQFYDSPSADPSGHGQGQTLMGTRLVKTDANGNVTFDVSFPFALANGQYVSATATNLPLSDTSEFAADLQVSFGTVTPNQPPTVDMGGPYVIDEGSPLTLDASHTSDPDGDPLTYSWDINGDGVFGDATGVNPTLTWAQLEALGIINGPSSFTVQLQVNDGQGHVVTAQTTLTVNNVPPTADAGEDFYSAEGSSVTLTGTFTDPGDHDTHTLDWHVDADNGQVIADGTGPTFDYTPDDNGTYTVTFTVTDSDGGVGTAVVYDYVYDVPPTATVDGLPAQGTVGVPINLSAVNIQDPSPVDQAAGFTFNWFAYDDQDFDDANFSGSDQTFSFTPTEPGTYDVELYVFDKDGGYYYEDDQVNVVDNTGSNPTPTVTVSDAGGVYTGSPYAATGEVNGADSLEGVFPTFTYYQGSMATGTPLSGAPTGVGTYTVVASFAGSTDYSSADSDPLIFSITAATPSVTVSDAGGTYNGSAYSAAAMVNGAASLEGISPTILYYAGTEATGTPLAGAPSAAGTYTAVASFAGSADYSSQTSDPTTFTISKATAAVTVTDAGGTFDGSAYPATAKVNGGASLEGIFPTLTYYAGSTATGTPLSGAPSDAGMYTVVASFPGSTDYGSDSSLPLTFTISQAMPSVTVTDAGGTYNGSPYPATAKINGGASLEGVVPALTYYSGSTATGTPLSGAPSAAGMYTVVASFAGTTDYGSASSLPVTFTISQATPSVTVTDAGGTYNGSPYPAVAKVNGGVSLEGVVPTLTYYSGSTATGTPLAGAPTIAGTYTVVANFSGSADYGSASSLPLTFTIAQAAPSVTVTDAGGTYNGSAYPAVAKVNGSANLEGIAPTLTYYSGSTATGTPLLGVPTGAGMYTVVAGFAGSTDYSAATSLPLTFTIGQATPTVTIADAGGPHTGSPYPATALVNGATTLEGVAPTITYFSGSTAAGTPLSGAPSGSGTYTAVANFAGSADYAGAASLPVTFTIAAVPAPTVTVTDAGGTYNGSPYPATAQVNGSASLEGVYPTLAYYSGPTATGTPLSGAPSTAGTYTVVANFAGSADYASASSAPVTFTIGRATPSISITDAGGTYNGSPYPAVAKVNGAAALEGIAPSITYYTGSLASGTPLSAAPSAAGTYTAVATFAGSTDYAGGSSLPLTFVIAQATPTVTITDAGGPANGSAYPATAKVNGAASLEGITPTITYYSGSAATGTPLTGAPSAAGTYTAVANFAGSTDYTGASSSPVTFTISSSSKTVPTVTVSDCGGTYNGTAFAASAKVNGGNSLEGVTPTLAYYAGSTASGTPLSAAPINAGTYTVVASFAGSAHYAAASSAPLTFTIAKATPKIVLACGNNSFTYTGSAVSISATVAGINGRAASTLEGVGITYAYYAGGKATGTALSSPPVNAGTYTLVATFAGSADYKSTSATDTFTIVKAAPTVVVIPPTTLGANATATVTGVNGSKITDGTVTFKYFLSTDRLCQNPLSGPPTKAGTYIVIAYFSGDSNYTSAQSALVTFKIGK